MNHQVFFFLFQLLYTLGSALVILSKVYVNHLKIHASENFVSAKQIIVAGNFGSQLFAHVGNYLWPLKIKNYELHKYFSWIKLMVFGAR